MSTQHALKVVPPYFDALLDGSKTFEVRKNDRGFQCGDELVLEEYDPKRGDHDPRWPALQSGYVVLGLELGSVEAPDG